MVDNPLSTIFGFIGPFYGFVVPLSTVLILTLLYIASMSNSGAKPREVGEAIFCYTLHGASVLLMTIGALPTVFSVFASVAYTGRTYVALLLVFACGGVLFLMQDQAMRNLGNASKAVPEAIYFYSLKILGNLIVLFSILSIFLNIVLGTFQPGWWVTPFVLLLYGLLLSWSTKDNSDIILFHATPVAKRASISSALKRSASKKRKPKRKH